jgi:hypothetical protein
MSVRPSALPSLQEMRERARRRRLRPAPPAKADYQASLPPVPWHDLERLSLPQPEAPADAEADTTPPKGADTLAPGIPPTHTPPTHTPPASGGSYLPPENSISHRPAVPLTHYPSFRAIPTRPSGGVSKKP